jgi:hypothetical protein
MQSWRALWLAIAVGSATSIGIDGFHNIGIID